MRYIVLAMVFLSACASTVETDYMTGTEGLSVSFGPMQMTAYEANPYSLIADIENKGVYPDAYGKVILQGYDRSILPFSDTIPGKNYAEKQMPQLDPRTALFEGGMDSVEFEISENSIYLPSTEPYKPNLILSLCYYYETLAAPTVCIVPDPSIEGVCKPDTITMQSQGAPIAITRVEQQIMRDFVNFVVTVENVGGGTVVSPDMGGYDACPAELKFDKINQVKVDMAIHNMPAPVCTPDGYVRLNNGKGTIFCKFQIRPETTYYEDRVKDSYAKQLQIIARYHYNTNTEQSIMVSKMPGMIDLPGDNAQRPGSS